MLPSKNCLRSRAKLFTEKIATIGAGGTMPPPFPLPLPDFVWSDNQYVNQGVDYAPTLLLLPTPPDL